MPFWQKLKVEKCLSHSPKYIFGSFGPQRVEFSLNIRGGGGGALAPPSNPTLNTVQLPRANLDSRAEMGPIGFWWLCFGLDCGQMAPAGAESDMDLEGAQLVLWGWNRSFQFSVCNHISPTYVYEVLLFLFCPDFFNNIYLFTTLFMTILTFTWR